MRDASRCKDCGRELKPDRFRPSDSSNMTHNLQVRCRGCVLGILVRKLK